MKEKVKLTELTKDELRQVRGGIAGNMADVEPKCQCEKKRQGYFGLEKSSKGGTITAPIPITRPEP